jgi:hypothetical protein
LENLVVDGKIKGEGGLTYPTLSSFQTERKIGMYNIILTHILNRLSIIHLPCNWQHRMVPTYCTGIYQYENIKVIPTHCG